MHWTTICPQMALAAGSFDTGGAVCDAQCFGDAFWIWKNSFRRGIALMKRFISCVADEDDGDDENDGDGDGDDDDEDDSIWILMHSGATTSTFRSRWPHTYPVLSMRLRTRFAPSNIPITVMTVESQFHHHFLEVRYDYYGQRLATASSDGVSQKNL